MPPVNTEQSLRAEADRRRRARRRPARQGAGARRRPPAVHRLRRCSARSPPAPTSSATTSSPSNPGTVADVRAAASPGRSSGPEQPRARWSSPGSRRSSPGAAATRTPTLVQFWKSTGVAGKGGVIDPKEISIWVDWLAERASSRRTRSNPSDLYTNEYNPYATARATRPAASDGEAIDDRASCSTVAQGLLVRDAAAQRPVHRRAGRRPRACPTGRVPRRRRARAAAASRRCSTCSAGSPRPPRADPARRPAGHRARPRPRHRVPAVRAAAVADRPRATSSSAWRPTGVPRRQRARLGRELPRPGRPDRVRGPLPARAVRRHEAARGDRPQPRLRPARCC